MANDPTKPGTPLDLDKPRRLLFDFNALAALEEKTGKNMLDAASWQSEDARFVRLILWASLLHEDPELTVEDAGALMHPENLPKIMAALKAQTAIAMPEAPPGPLAKKPTRRKRRRTG